MNEPSSSHGDSWTSRYEALREGIRGDTSASGTALILRFGLVGWLEEGDRLPALPSVVSVSATAPRSALPAAAAILANMAGDRTIPRRNALRQTSTL